MRRRLSPDHVAYAFVALAGLVVLWNAARYPAGAGYDATSHREYAAFLVDHHRLPKINETPEYYSPPLYFALAGVLERLGGSLGLADGFKLAQLWNAAAVVGTLLLTIALARRLWPERRWLPAAAAGFLALSPVLTRTASMINPEPTDLLFSVLSLYLAARVLAGRRYDLRAAIALGLAVGAQQMVRQFALWTLAVIALASIAALWSRPEERGQLTRALLVAFAACIVVAGPWYGYRAATYSNAIFDRPATVDKPLLERRPASFYVSPGIPDVFARPYRPHLVNLAVPQTYSDMWGDWYGVFAWDRGRDVKPAAGTNGWLVFQNILGLAPTLIAVAGWLLLLARSLRRRDAPRLLAALLPLAGIAGYLYFTVSFPTPDGDVLKPTYMLSTAAAWALCFGWAVTKVGERYPRLVAALVVLAVLDLPFVIYKGAVS